MKSDPNYVDRFIGNKIKERRKVLKFSQSKLADLLGLSYQQIQKYENGSNKITVRRIVQIAALLNVPMSYFYEGLNLEDEMIDDENSDILKTRRTRPLNILLVDDNASDEILMTKAMEDSEEEIELNSIQDPEKVLDYLRHHEEKYGKPRPDVIFLDITMPKIDGLTLLKQIKREQNINEIPVIMLTNSINAKEMKDGYKNHASGFIPKSVDYAEFAERVFFAIRYWSQSVVLPRM